MPSYITGNPADPIIHRNLQKKLTLVEGGSLSQNDIGVWTLVRRYTCPNGDAIALLPKRLSADYERVYPTLYLDTIQATTGKAMTTIVLTYRGLIGGSPAPVGEMECPLQSAQLTDNAGHSVSCFYYGLQTNWRWASSAYPTSPVTLEIAPCALEITPFNTNPPTPLSSLLYKLVKQVSNFKVTFVANHYECTATISVALLSAPDGTIYADPTDVDPGGGLSSGSLATGTLDTGGLG